MILNQVQLVSPLFPASFLESWSLKHINLLPVEIIIDANSVVNGVILDSSLIFVFFYLRNVLILSKLIFMSELNLSRSKEIDNYWRLTKTTIQANQVLFSIEIKLESEFKSNTNAFERIKARNHSSMIIQTESWWEESDASERRI